MRSAALVRLAGALVLGRARDALSRRFGAGGLVSGALFQLATHAVLVFAGLFYAWVAASLIGTLAERGNESLTALAAGAHAELVLLLVLLTTLLTQEESTGLDLRPLAPLALAPHDRLLAGLFAELFLRPGALIVWPSAGALLIGLGQAGATASALSVMGAAGLVVLAVGLALFVRRVVSGFGGIFPSASLPALALRMALVLLPLAWALGAVGHLEGAMTGPEALLRPGHWFAGCAGAALAGERAALLWGTGPLLVGLGLLVTAGRLEERVMPISVTSNLPWRSTRRASSALAIRIWRLPRARLVVAQSLTAGLALVVLAGALAAHGVQGAPVAALASILVAWIVAAGPSPLAANALGAGGRANALALSGAPHPERWLLVSLAWITLPPAFAATLAGLLVAWVLGAPSAASLSTALALALALATMGAGALSSVTWPWSSALEGPGDPVWPPGPGRWMLPLAHGLPLAIAALPLFSGESFATPIACGMIVSAGAAVGGASFWAARRLLLERRARVVEKLLS